MLLLLLTGRYSISALLNIRYFVFDGGRKSFCTSISWNGDPAFRYIFHKNSFNVAMNYSLFWDQALLIAFAVVLVNTGVTCWLTRAFDTTEKKRVGSGCGCVECEYSGRYQYICSKLSRNCVGSVRADVPRSKEIGFLLIFVKIFPYFIYQKPKGYSLEYAICIAGAGMCGGNHVPDNIIVIMNESFTDLGFLGELEADQEYLPNFYRVINEENSKMG